MTDSLASLRNHLEQVERAIVTGAWETVTGTWTPPTTPLSPEEAAEAAVLLARVEEAREEVSRLEAETTEVRAEIDLVRRAGRAYVTNDALL